MIINKQALKIGLMYIFILIVVLALGYYWGYNDGFYYSTDFYGFV